MRIIVAGFLATTISARSGGLTGPLYVHAKIGIVDDSWLTVGSANLNEHLFFNDTGEQLERRKRGEPLTHRLQELPGTSRRSMGLLGPLDSLLVDG